MASLGRGSSLDGQRTLKVSGAAPRALGLVFAMALLLGSAAPSPAAVRFKSAGEATLGGADALANVPGACEIAPDHVWVTAEGRGECIAFYATESLGTAKQAVLYFEGDIPLSYRRDRAKLNKHLSSLRRSLATLAAAFHVPYVAIARPGTFGSTGNHSERRKDREFLVMRAAVDAIRSKFALDDVSLAGQSGGATIVGALLTLGISNVKCAVPASGGYDLTAMLDWHAARMGVVGVHREHPAILSDSYNVMDRISGVRIDAARRVFVVGDPRDQVTPFDQQKRFAEALKTTGHRVELVELGARGPEHHSLSFKALKLAGLCATDATDAQIRDAAKAP